jgi:hypothetical protein
MIKTKLYAMLSLAAAIGVLAHAQPAVSGTQSWTPILSYKCIGTSTPYSVPVEWTGTADEITEATSYFDDYCSTVFPQSVGQGCALNVTYNIGHLHMTDGYGSSYWTAQCGIKTNAD